MYTQESLLSGTVLRQIIEEERWFDERGEERPTGRTESKWINGGVLSRQRADDLIHSGQEEDWLIKSAGVTAMSDRKIVFLTDDDSIQLNLPKGFYGLKWRLPNQLGYPGKAINNASEYLDHFYPGVRVIESMEELLAYLNN